MTESAGSREEPLSSPTDWVADHVRRYVESDGEDGHFMQGVPCLLLTTRGHKSGRLRRTPVVYGQDGDRLVVVASRGGDDQHPSWYLNIEKDPEVHTQILAEHSDRVAHVAVGEERERLWEMMVGVFGEFEAYQKKTERQIPVVVLERR